MYVRIMVAVILLVFVTGCIVSILSGAPLELDRWVAPIGFGCVIGLASLLEE